MQKYVLPAVIIANSCHHRLCLSTLARDVFGERERAVPTSFSNNSALCTFRTPLPATTITFSRLGPRKP